MSDERPPWLGPALILVAAFCGGVQLAFIIQMFTGTGYFSGALLLKFTTLALLAASIYLLMSPERQAALRDRAAELFDRSRDAVDEARERRRERAAERGAVADDDAIPPVDADAPEPATTQRAAPRPPVNLDLETPLTGGPVWPPGEPIPITIEIRVQGPHSQEDIDVEVELRHAGGTETARVPLKGSAAVLSQTVPTEGPFTLTARALRDGDSVSETTVEGLATPYREEIGRRFEQLKSSAGNAGLPIGPDATPRELHAALVERHPALRSKLDDLVTAIEFALYSEEDVTRETYEGLVQGLVELERVGVEARTHA